MQIPQGTIQSYLTPSGLDRLKHNPLKAMPLEQAKKLVTKLVILDELLTYFGEGEIELGFNGGLKYALLLQAIDEYSQKRRDSEVSHHEDSQG